MGKMNNVYALIFVYFVGIVFKSSLCQTNDVAGSKSDVNVTQSNSSVSDFLGSDNNTNTNNTYISSDNSTVNFTNSVFSTEIRDSSIVTMDTNLTLTSSISFNDTNSTMNTNLTLSSGISFNDTESHNVTISGDGNEMNINRTSNVTVSDIYNDTQNDTRNRSITTSSANSTSLSSQPERPTDSSDAGTAVLSSVVPDSAVSDSSSSSAMSGLDNFDSGVLQPLGGSLDSGDVGFVDTADGGFVDIGGADGFGDLSFGPGDVGFGDGISEYDICAHPPCDFPTTPAPTQDITSPPAPPPPPPPPPPVNVFDSLIPNIIPAPMPPSRHVVISPNTNVMAEDLKNKIENLRQQFFAFQANNQHSGSSSGLNFFDPLSLLSQNSDPQSSIKTPVQSNIRTNVITGLQSFPNTAGNTINIKTNTIDKNMVPGVPNLAASTNIKTALVGSNPNIPPPPPPPSELDSIIKGNKPRTNSFKTTQSFTRTSSSIQPSRANRISDSSSSPWPYRPGKQTSNYLSVSSRSVSQASGPRLNNVNSAGQVTNPQLGSLSGIKIDQRPNTSAVGKTSSTSTSQSNTVKNEFLPSVPATNSASGINSIVIQSSPTVTNVNSNTIPSSFSNTLRQTNWLDTTFTPGMPLFRNANLPISNGNSAQITVSQSSRNPISQLDNLLFNSRSGGRTHVQTFIQGANADIVNTGKVTKTDISIADKGTNFNPTPGIRTQDSRASTSDNAHFANKVSTFDKSLTTHNNVQTTRNFGSHLDQLVNAGIPAHRSNLNFARTSPTSKAVDSSNRVNVNAASNPREMVDSGSTIKIATNSGANTVSSSISRTSGQSTGVKPSPTNTKSQVSARSPGIPMWSGNNFDSIVFGNRNSFLPDTSSVDTGRQTVHSQNSNTALVNTGAGPPSTWRTSGTRQTSRSTSSTGEKFIGTPRQVHPTIILPQKQSPTRIPSTSGFFNLPQPSPVEAPPTDSQAGFPELPPPPPADIGVDANEMMNRIMNGQGFSDPVITTKRSPRLHSGNLNIPRNTALTNQAFLIKRKTVDIQNSGSTTVTNSSKIGLGTSARTDIGTNSDTNIATKFGSNTDSGVSSKDTATQSDALSMISLVTTTNTPSVQPNFITATEPRNGTSALRRELPNAAYICKNCRFVNGFCYVEMPGNCNRFIECFRQGIEVRAFEKECSFGLFWHQGNITCQIAYDVKCASDPCQNLTVRNHPYIGKCRAYWTCKKGASNARCCPKGYGYGGTAGKKECVPMATCQDECVATPTEREMKIRRECLLKEDPSSSFRFIEGTQSLPCAPGTRFSLQECTCIQSKKKSAPLPTVCSKDLYLNFDGEMNEPIRDSSGKGSIIETSNVFLEPPRSIAKFNQNGRIKLWKYANLKLGPSLAITFKFLPYRGYSRMQTLLSNCNDENEMAAIDISLDTWFSNVIFKVETTSSQNNHVNEIKIKYTPFHWNDVVLVYNEGSLAAAVGKVYQFKFIEGQIPNRHPAISLGGCGKNSRNGFIGYMDSVSIYNGCIPDDLENNYLFG